MTSPTGAGSPLDGTAPCLLYGYGAYESCEWPEFSVAVPSLLDRGVRLRGRRTCAAAARAAAAGGWTAG